METWSLVVLAENASALDALQLGKDWRPLTGGNRIRVWTDDYTAIMAVLR